MPNWVNRMFGALGFEQRSSLENPQTPLSFPAEWLLDIFNGGRTDSGIRVSEMTALQVGTVFACVNIISNGLAALPFHVYERMIQKERMVKKIAYDHDLWEMLHDEPNPEMTRFSFLKTLMVHDLLWGNAYAEIQRNQANQIIALWPRNPARTRPIRLIRPMMIEGTVWPMGTLLFETSESAFANEYPTASDDNKEMQLGKRRLILAEDMIHVPGLSLDGRLGQSTVYLARQILGLALATEKYGAKFFGNGARPAGILTIPNKMEDRAIETLRRSWAEAHGGENQFKVAVLEQGVKYEKIAATPEEGQMLGTRQYERSEICAVFNVPLHMVAASEKSGKSNVEQSSIEFVQFCLKPWLIAYEQEFGRKLFPKMGRSANKYFPHFDKRQLLYPDAESRSKFYASGKQWGYLNTNDIHELEDMNPVTDGTGEIYMVQVNMQNAVALVDGGAADGSKPEPAPAPAGPQPGAAPVNKPGVPTKAKPKPKGKGKRGLYELPQGKNFDMYIMRHGTTDANEKNLYRGWGDFELDQDGIDRAHKAADSLKGKSITHIVTSSLVRHQQTAKIVSDDLGGLPIVVDEDFKTLHVGVFTGHSREEVGDDFDWFMENPDEVIPGGESLNAFRARNSTAFSRVRIANNRSGPTLVITSRSNLSALKESGGLKDGEKGEVAEPGGVYRLDAVNNLEMIFGDEVKDSLTTS